jgi:hypothetical protein
MRWKKKNVLEIGNSEIMVVVICKNRIMSDLIPRDSGGHIPQACEYGKYIHRCEQGRVCIWSPHKLAKIGIGLCRGTHRTIQGHLLQRMWF